MSEKLMYRQRLLAGADYSQDYEANPDPETGKYPLKLFKKGDVVWSEEDLVAKEPARYGAVGPPRAREPVAVTKSAPAEPEKKEAKPDGSTLSVKKANSGFTKEELAALSNAELHDLCENMKLNVPKTATKAQLVAALSGGNDGE